MTHDPRLNAARENHDDLPKSKYFNEGISKEEIEHDKKTTFQRGFELGQVFKAAIEEHYSSPEQEQVRDNLLKAIIHLATKAKIFPDMDYENIWYTDYYDLIKLAKDMGVGDDTLPHWPEEKNISKRYLELSSSDLFQIFLAFSEEALLDECQFGADIDKWVEYLFRETLKSRRRFARERQKQNDTLYFSPPKDKLQSKEESQSDEFSFEQAEYKFGVDLGRRIAEKEYIETLREAIQYYHAGSISKLKANMEVLLNVCNRTVQEITPGANFSFESFEAHVCAAAKIAAYYAVIQLYLRHPSISREKIETKLGLEFYDSLLKAIGSALSFSYVQKILQLLEVLKWIDETATKVEEKIKINKGRGLQE